MAHRCTLRQWTWRKKIRKTEFKYCWHTEYDQHCLLTEGNIGTPIFTSANSSVRLAYFHTNNLLTGLYKTETEICWRKYNNKIKKQTDIVRHGPKPSLNSSQTPNPPPFSLSTIFKGSPNSTKSGLNVLHILPWFLFNFFQVGK